MPQKDVEIVRTTLRIPRKVYDAAVECADDMYQSFNQFAVQAVAQRMRNWEEPVTRQRVGQRQQRDKWDGWVCTHGSHAVMPAAECPARDKQVHRQEMVHEATGQVGWSPPEEG